MSRPEVIVIGAGLAGLSVAWHLRGSARLLVLDRARAPGAEASAQNAGLVRRLVEDPVERSLALRANPWLQAHRAFRRTGAVHALGHDATHLHDAAAHLRARGVRVEPLDRLTDVAPAAAGAPLSHALYVPDDGVADSAILVADYVDALRAAGVEIRCDCPAELTVEGDRVTGVTTPHGPISSERVVLATGAWSAGLGATPPPLIPLRRTLHTTALHPLSTPDHPWIWIEDAGLYARPEAGGWMICACDERIDRPDAIAGSSRPATDDQAALTDARLRRWLPALADVRWTGGSSGLRTFAPDRRPVLGADAVISGVWWLAGLGGSGVTAGHAAGEAVAIWMQGGDTPWLRRAAVAPGRAHLGRWPIRPDGSQDGSVLVTT